jgi:HPt (histidine-containing phosphotransfer) domain-containing protein
MIDLFLRDAPPRMAEIRNALAGNDAAAARRAAHALKSSSANLGAAALADLCKRLERECRDGAAAESRALADAIEDEYSYVAADLTERMRETAA